MKQIRVPKDISAISYRAQELGVDIEFLQSVSNINESAHKE